MGTIRPKMAVYPANHIGLLDTGDDPGFPTICTADDYVAPEDPAQQISPVQVEPSTSVFGAGLSPERQPSNVAMRSPVISQPCACVRVWSPNFEIPPSLPSEGWKPAVRLGEGSVSGFGLDIRVAPVSIS